MAKYAFNDDEREQYRREGYIVVNSVFTADDLAPVEQAIDELTARAIASGGKCVYLELEPEPIDGRRVPRRIYSPYDQHGAFQTLATSPKVLDRIESLIGPSFSLHHSKLNMKPARVGSSVEWHQDLAFFPHTNDDLVTMLIYLDEATEENGCLQVLPRHHSHFFNHALPDGTFAGLITEEIDSGRFGRPVPLAAPAGSVIFMHCITPHSSLPNRSTRPRRTLIFEYRATDAFPVFYGQGTLDDEAGVRPLRGQPARFARFGGPAPMIPKQMATSAIYDLQAQSKAKIDSMRKPASMM
jgi:ectoine hydroxylase-related dioxygenase (phytanoyl-CoA dioxygenase family)